MSKMNAEDYETFPRKRRINIVMRHGVSFGSALAMAISFNINHSVLWAIYMVCFHGFMWFIIAWLIRVLWM